MMKKIVILLLVILGFILLNCEEGYHGKDGAMLKEYLPVEKLKELLDNPHKDIWIVDLNSESVYKNGHIPTARNFSSTTILKHLKEISKNQYLILTCDTAGKVQIVAKGLEKVGYTRFMYWGTNSKYFDKYGSVK